MTTGLRDGRAAGGQLEVKAEPKKHLATETAEQCTARLAQLARNWAKGHAREADCVHQAKIRAAETEDQRKARQQLLSSNQALCLECETDDQRQARLELLSNNQALHNSAVRCNTERTASI